MALTRTKTFQNFIAGEWADAASGETFETVSPADGETLGTFPKSSAEDVDRAVEAAKAAYEEWRLLPAPALVCGNTIVFKPATDTPLLGERFVELLTEAGIPPGFVNIVHGGGGAVGDRLGRHPDVPVITLTGSRETGVQVMRNAAEHLK